MKSINASFEKVIDLMGRLDFFDEFGYMDKLAVVEKKGAILVAEQNELIIKAHSSDSHLYIPLSGELKVSLFQENNTEIILAKVLPGDMVGEIAFLTGAIRTANVIAVEKTILFRCSRQVLNSLSPSAREKIKDLIITKLVRRLQENNELMASVKI